MATRCNLTVVYACLGLVPVSKRMVSSEWWSEKAWHDGKRASLPGRDIDNADAVRRIRIRQYPALRDPRL